MLQTKHTNLILTISKLVLLEIGLGTLIGITASYLIIWFTNRIKLAESLYPLFALSSGMFIFAAAPLLGGSGYLAIYLAGMIVGNSQIHQHENVLRLHDSLAWLSQIGVFLMLGLLVTPSVLLPGLLPSLLIALALIFVIRPTAVWINLLPFKFDRHEKAFIAWTGLRGAVPIIPAINPLLVGLKQADLYFNITFFIVVISIILQGWPLLTIAYWLKVKID